MEKLNQLAYEVTHYYGGPSADCKAIVTFPFEKDSQPVTMSKAEGLVVGDAAKGGLRTNIAVFCKNDTV